MQSLHIMPWSAKPLQNTLNWQSKAYIWDKRPTQIRYTSQQSFVKRSTISRVLPWQAHLNKESKEQGQKKKKKKKKKKKIKKISVCLDKTYLEG